MSDPSNRRDDESIPDWAIERARELSRAEAREGDENGSNWVPDVPEDVVDEAERLTRLARRAADPDAAAAYRDRRDRLVSEAAYTARIRDEDDTLVLYPDEWVDDGTVQFDRIEDTDRAVEVSLSGPGDAERYDEIAAHHADVVDRIAETHGDAHAANVRAFGEFMANHYVKPMESATPAERAEFRSEYYPRNVWPTDEERAVVEESLSLVVDELTE